MNFAEQNKEAWSKLSKEHYETFKKRLSAHNHQLNPHIQRELGDLQGKSIIHLQCNTGADTILLAKMAKSAVGVDFSADNVFYANQLAKDFEMNNISFIESDIMDFMDKHNKKYDIVFVSEGAIGWLPDLDKWGKTIKHLLKDDGFFYIFDAHPFSLMFDEKKMGQGFLEIKYPYFSQTPSLYTKIGGWAAEKQTADNYFWIYKVSDIINALVKNGLNIEYFNEFTELFFDKGAIMEELGNGLYNYRWNDNKFPNTFSLKATKGAY